MPTSLDAGVERVTDESAPVTHQIGAWRPTPLPVEFSPVAPVWTYDGSDPGLRLFTASLARFNFTFLSGHAVLELGCLESDWLERMARMDPTLRLTGIDTRAEVEPHGPQRPRLEPGIEVLSGSAMDPTLFDAESFDRVVLLSALEHFGLGFYGDPVDEYGDMRAMMNVAKWLKPGGFVYFDVPCQPTYRVSANRHLRAYAPMDIQGRLLGPAGLEEVNRGYSLPDPHAGMWCHEPRADRVPHWLVAVVAQKPERTS